MEKKANPIYPLGSSGHGTLEVGKDELVIRIPTTEEARRDAVPSSTGKTRLLGSSNGMLPIPGSDIKISVNVTIPK